MFAAAFAINATLMTGLAAATAKKPVNQRQGIQTQFKIEPNGPIPYVLGRTAVGGTVVHRKTYGTDNHYKTYFVALSGAGPVKSISFTADRAATTFTGTKADGFYHNWMWQDQQLGVSNEAAALTGGVVDPPFGTAGPVPDWGASYKMSGYAAAGWSLLFDTKARRYANGEPLPGWVVEGVKVYDPRLDSTYPGGSGSCRWADPSDITGHAAAKATWVYSETPALHALMWNLGRWDRDEDDPSATYKRVVGVGASIDLVDVAAYVTAANVQEANGWKVGGQLDSSMDRWTALKLIEEAGGSEPVANGALLSTLINAPRVSAGTVTEADLADGALSISTIRPRRERINGYRARIRSESHGWEMVDLDIVQVSTYVTADGGERTGSGDFALVQDPDQGAELAAYKVFNARESPPIVLPLKPKWVGARIGDCLTLNLPQAGLNNQDCIIRARSLDPATGIVTLTFITETADKHTAALGLTGTVPPAPTLTIPDGLIGTPDSADWAATGETLTDNGASIPAVVATGAVADTNADGVVFDYRVYVSGAGDEDNWMGAGTESPALTRKEITSVTPGTQYEISVRYKKRVQISDRLILGPVTAGSFETAGNISSIIRAAYIKISTDLLTGEDASGSGKITIADHDWDYAGQAADISRIGGTITGLSLATRYYVYFDDATLTDTTPTYYASLTIGDALNSTTNPYRHYLDYVDIPASGAPPSGGGGTGGGGYGCPCGDMYLRTRDSGIVQASAIAVDDYVWGKHEITGVWGWYRVSAAAAITQPTVSYELSGRVFRTSASHLNWVNGGWRMSSSLPGATQLGDDTVYAITVDDAHTYELLASVNAERGVLSHNKLVNPDV